MFLSVFDNFLNKELLSRVDKELLTVEWPKLFKRAGSHMHECGDIKKYPILFELYNTFCCSKYLEFLESITNIKGLIPDPYLIGSGYSQIKDMGDLKPHIDFNWNDRLKLFRKLTLIIYLSSPKKGGEIEFIDFAKVKVKKNRAVIFSHSETIRHFVHPVKGIRNAVRFFYYCSDLSNPKNFHRSLYSFKNGRPADLKDETSN